MARPSAGPPEKSGKAEKPKSPWDAPFDLDKLQQEQRWDDDDYILGMDEAGRGPALGTMVYGAAYCRIRDHAELLTYGVADSKQLSEQQRGSCYDRITGGTAVRHKLREITAEEISARQLGRAGQSLNKISHSAQVELVRQIKSEIAAAAPAGAAAEEGAAGEGPEAKRRRTGGRLVGLFVDVVGPQYYHQDTLQKAFPECFIVVISKADSRFPITSAASIVAKVSRDRGLQRWSFAEAIAPSRVFGSGYPSDPVTCKWMRDNLHRVFLFPRIARFDWDPVRKAEKKHCVAMTWVPPESDAEQSAAKRWQYFEEMWLEPAHDF